MKCWCIRDMRSTDDNNSYKTCMFHPLCPVFSEGEGISVSGASDRIYLGTLTDEDCVSECTKRRASDGTINGISFSGATCYCERRMALADGSGWRMCFLKRSCDLDCGEHGSCKFTRTGNMGCKCAVGWTGKQCQININECAHNNGGCAHICIDTEGSFECKCKSAYTLNKDGLNCDEKRFTVVVQVPKNWKKKRGQRELKIEL